MPKDHENLHYDLYEAVKMKVTWPTLNIVRYLCILRLITGVRDERSEQNIRETRARRTEILIRYTQLITADKPSLPKRKVQPLR